MSNGYVMVPREKLREIANACTCPATQGHLDELLADERAEFIKAMHREGWLEDPEGGGDAVAAWWGWEARAALERKP